jgi:hypothetical protein
MVTVQKLKPCPKCGEANLPIYKYESGWQHVECDECFYLGPGGGSRVSAARLHNESARLLLAESVAA